MAEIGRTECSPIAVIRVGWALCQQCHGLLTVVASSSPTAASCIGKEVAKRIVEAEAKVVITDRDATKLEQAANENDPNCEHVRLFAGDIALPSTA